MRPLLLGLSHAIDRLNRGVAWLASGCILLAVLVSAGNALARKFFNFGSNGLLELQWYLFGAVFLLCAGYTLLQNEHVRVDLLYSRLQRRGQLRVEVFGLLVFMLPATTLILSLSWEPFLEAWRSGEVSPNAGGLIRWPAKLLIPAGFTLLLLQGISELIKRIDELRQLPAGATPDLTPGETRHG
ncbi:TRAP transporter small permease subunit [Pseudomonas mangiferae]|uniref:TRAP transporter small permease protein n=1 Tax=Pseudomonas mangiferae TaxID=2593654 RepID=A0A553H091_9PSED|nr:TRAP transporter small permease subunit [Pseudomonas mangiferae]TRX75178.1 TRAP transporter small permease subunit [Pseudomonas mangiferae]